MEQLLLPKSSLDISEAEFESVSSPSKTWKIDLERKCIVGTVDGLDAVEQSIYLALNTARFRHLIFSWNYGCEYETLVGKAKDYARAEIPRLTRECLYQDDRILTVDNFVMTDIEEGLSVTFDVSTKYGNTQIEMEVDL